MKINLLLQELISNIVKFFDLFGINRERFVNCGKMKDINGFR